MLVIRADAVTFDDTHRVVPRAQLLIGDDGRLAGVLDEGAALPAAFAGARVVTHAGYAYPGLVDFHNHIPYNTIGLWRRPDRPTPFLHHDQWTTGPYSEQITAPQKFLGWAAGVSLLTYVETKAVLGGTTTIQGNGRVHPRDGVLTRNLDTERFGGAADRIRVDTLVKDDVAGFDTVVDSMLEGAGYVYHLAEGVPQKKMTDEFELARDGGVIRQRFVGIHGTGLDPAQLRVLTDASSSLVWSPFSNMWLYGATADIVTARAQGLRLCLGSDWQPSGTRNVLGELKVASLWNRDPAKWYPEGVAVPAIPPGGVFSDRDLCDLVTRNPGDVIADIYRGPEVGRLQEGYLADLILVARNQDDPYRNLIHATEPDVELVLVGGEVRAGTAALVKQAGTANTRVVKYRGKGGQHSRQVLLRHPQKPDVFLTWTSVTSRLNAVRADPVGADQELAFALATASAGDPVFVVEGDMPMGEGEFAEVAGGPAVKPRPVAIPPIDPLAHDPAFFDLVDSHPYHRGLLSPLREFYA